MEDTDFNSEEEIVDDTNAEEEEFIQGSAEYSPKSEFNKGKQVDDAVRTCIESRGEEMRAGYWNTTMSNTGTPIKTWIKDSRKVFISKVNALMCLLAPEIDTDFMEIKKEGKKIKRNIFKSKKFNEQLQKVFDKYCYEEKKQEKKYDSVNNRILWKSTGIKYMPDVDANVTIQDPSNSSKAISGRGLWNSKINAYLDETLLIYDKIFAELNRLIHRTNYFKQQQMWY